MNNTFNNKISYFNTFGLKRKIIMFRLYIII